MSLRGRRAQSASGLLAGFPKVLGLNPQKAKRRAENQRSPKVIKPQVFNFISIPPNLKHGSHHQKVPTEPKE
jgi:hypothetical protein